MPVSSDNGRRRVVVTGIGAVTSLGNTFEKTWEGLIAGRSGAGPITQFDTTGFPVTFRRDRSIGTAITAPSAWT